MKNELIKISYDGENGSSDIRTFHDNDQILYVSLRDIIRTLNQENRSFDERHVSKSMLSIIRAQMQVLDSDEYKMIPVIDGSYAEDEEVFVTQPGLYRVLSSDRSYAGKRFQRWLFHEVIPALTKYGQYPAPVVSQDSEIKRLAQIVLMEIEQREKTELQNQAKFIEHERQLAQLGDKLQSIESKAPNLDFLSVPEYCNKNLIDKTHEQLIFGWCIKICGEEKETSEKRVINGKKVLFFPPHVINSAFSEIKKP